MITIGRHGIVESVKRIDGRWEVVKLKLSLKIVSLKCSETMLENFLD
jgi:hypothetical protein